MPHTTAIQAFEGDLTYEQWESRYEDIRARIKRHEHARRTLDRRWFAIPGVTFLVMLLVGTGGNLLRSTFNLAVADSIALGLLVLGLLGSTGILAVITAYTARLLFAKDPLTHLYDQSRALQRSHPEHRNRYTRENGIAVLRRTANEQETT